jgi:hypothetical protein
MTQLRNLFDDGQHRHADRTEADQLPTGETPPPHRAGALGRRVEVADSEHDQEPGTDGQDAVNLTTRRAPWKSPART